MINRLMKIIAIKCFRTHAYYLGLFIVEAKSIG